MPSLGDISSALYGAWRLLRFDAGGMAWFDISLTGFWRSFFAAVLVAPGYVIFVWLDLAGRTEPFNLGWAVIVMGAAYILGWIVFPVAAIFLTQLLQLHQRYFALIIVYNWASVPQLLIMLPLTLIESSGLLPAGIARMLIMSSIAFILVYQWFVTRAALDTTPITTSGVVILQVLIGEFVHLGANGLI